MTGFIFRFACAMVLGVGSACYVPWTFPTIIGVWMLSWGLHACVRSFPTAGVLGLTFGLFVVALQDEGPLLNGKVVVQGRVVSTPVGRQADVSVGRWRRMDGEWIVTSGRIRVRFCDTPPPMGHSVSVLGTARIFRQRVLPSAPNPYSVAALSRVRTELFCQFSSQNTVSTVSEPHQKGGYRGVLYALATGDRSGVSEETWNTLRKTGTSHLLAISGFHIGLVAWAVYAFVYRLSHLYALWNPQGLNTRFLLIVPIVAAWAYAIGAGLPVSAQRATIMVSLIVLAKMMHRTVSPLDLVGLAAVIVLSIEPSALATPGFQLSFMAVIGLIRMTPWLVGSLPLSHWLLRWIWGAIATTLSASISTLPVSAWWFQEISWVSPVSNLLALPWVAWVVVPFAFGAVWLPESLSLWCFSIGDAAVGLLFWVLETLSYTPMVIAVTPLVCFCGVLLCLLPKRWSVVGLMAAQVSCGTQSDALILTMLDVGHGESVLVTWPTGEHWLIDGGPPGRGVLQYLRRSGIESLDVVVVTHGHRDHVGGLWTVLDEFPVDSIWLGKSWDDRVVQIAARRGIPITMNPTGTFSADASSANEQSLVLPIHWGGFSVLLTGDIGTATEPQLMREYRSPIDVLKVPHHGSRYSSSESFLEGLAPRIALISASGAYGLPHSDTLERYRARDILVLRTDTLGTIQLHIRPEGITGWSYRGDRGWRNIPIDAR